MEAMVELVYETKLTETKEEINGEGRRTQEVATNEGRKKCQWCDKLRVPMRVSGA